MPNPGGGGAPFSAKLETLQPSRGSPPGGEADYAMWLIWDVLHSRCLGDRAGQVLPQKGKKSNPGKNAAPNGLGFRPHQKACLGGESPGIPGNHSVEQPERWTGEKVPPAPSWPGRGGGQVSSTIQRS